VEGRIKSRANAEYDEVDRQGNRLCHTDEGILLVKGSRFFFRFVNLSLKSIQIVVHTREVEAAPI
jgi:hypothetical protein